MTLDVSTLNLPIGRATSSFEPVRLDLPTAFADFIGQEYAVGCDSEHRKSHGLYLTPPRVANFMACMIRLHDTFRLLDPAAGAGVLICAVVENLASQPNPPRKIEITAYEIDSSLAMSLRRVIGHLTKWAANKKIQVIATILEQDFILAKASSLTQKNHGQFDAVIANPPYFKVGKEDPRAIAAKAVVHGQPNIYGLFMAVAGSLLKEGGDFVFITPRSFASGPYFKRFREHFFSVVRPVKVHVFGSRRDAFSRDTVLQENVILHGIRHDNWSKKPESYPFIISSSAGTADLEYSTEWKAKLSDAIDSNNLSGAFRLPATQADDAILRRFDGWTGSLHRYGLDISTGPVVPFRATEHLAEKSNCITVPLLWLNHVRIMGVQWPNNGRKPEYINYKSDSRRLLVPNNTYVLLRRFSAKEENRRMTAAPLLAGQLPCEMIGLENHLNYIHRPEGIITEDEAFGLAALYNSSLFDGYFRCINGNTQVSATELRAMPLPPLEAIIKLGQTIRKSGNNLGLIDQLVDKLATATA